MSPAALFRIALTLACLMLSAMFPSAAAAQSHGGPVTGIAQLKDNTGNTIWLSSGFDGRVLAWRDDLAFWRLLDRKPFPLDGITAVDGCTLTGCHYAFSVQPPPRADWVFHQAFSKRTSLTVTREGVARLANGADVHDLPGEHHGLLQAAFRGGKLLLIKRQAPPLLFDAGQGQLVELPFAGISATSALFVSDDRLLTGSVDGQLSLIDLRGPALLHHEQLQQSPLTAIELVPEQNLVVTADANGTIAAWRLDGDALSLERVLAQFPFPLFAMQLDLDRGRVITAHQDGHLIAVPLAGEATLAAPPRPAALFAEAAAPASEGERLFRACAVCHDFKKEGSSKAGPSFYGLFGRQAGTLPGYPYSDALLHSDVIWDETTLSALFDEGPEHYLPGTTMPLQRMPDADDRAALIGYLKAQDPMAKGRN